ncbi:NmrA family NAD(P)-binding protein [Neptunitalea lumnitzerae]|uniref:NAD(P)-dependent oxidoreductase n=1 Tax=Neptunitalea lumnitzerae TaxID=2965509 RepID=A0ABQ5MJ46_9FLAO|nr:NmrA family NAD(P)-binding protein [Neptunitalea sp. Y10]GLB49405.1 NAD(P)-dependent oxidoreductase [Neptunitalea sp. Y10]
MILITGATGHLGYLTLTALLKQKSASEIAVLARKESDKTKEIAALGVEVRIGEYANKESLVKAFNGIETLFFVSTHEAAQDITVHQNVIDAAVQANIQRIVYTSTQGEKSVDKNHSEGAADMHAFTEAAIKQSGLNYTILRNAPYMESLPMILGEKVLTEGYAMPMGNGKLSFATRQDMAIGSANVLSTNEHDHKTYEFGGTASVGFNEVMEILSELTGKKLEYHPIDPETYEQQSKEAGIPEMYIQANLGFANQVKNGYFDHPTQDLANILGREPMSVEAFLKNTYQV